MRKRLGGRVQKLAIDTSMGCPNRDGRVAHGGCTFCLNEAFSPSYCREATSITEQIERGIAFHTARHRHGDQYLAYLQSGSNTYNDIERLEKIYHEALSHPAISGIIIGTRPDCISSEILDYLECLSHRYYIAVEYGIESTYDATLQHVNRGHDYSTAVEATAETKARGIDVGAHFILGLPNESRAEIIAQTASINRLNIDFVKFHQLQIYHNTPLAREWLEHRERFLYADGFTTEDYVDMVVDIVRHLDPNIAIERFASQAPRHHILYSPLGGIRMDALQHEIVNRLNSLNAKQGDLL